MAAKKKDLEAQLRDLTQRHEALGKVVNQLATHTSVIAVAVRDPQAVPPADLEAALSGIADLSRTPTQSSP